MKQLFFFFTITFLIFFPQHMEGIHPVNVNKVLDQLYAQCGNSLIIKPAIKIINTKEMVAAYYKKSNTIVLEKATLDLCKQFGKDSLSALAFIIGHEFMHTIQHVDGTPNSTTSYLAWASDTPGSKAVEKDADIGGIFLAYAAGYKTLKIVPEMIDKIYESYELSDINLKKYPSKNERKNSANLVIKQVENLIHLYEASSLLGAANHYEEAISCLEYILKYYKSKEMYNNLGVQYALMALNLGQSNPLEFIYPLELDFNTRLKKPKSARGDDALSSDQKKWKQIYLQKAKSYLMTALNMDMDYYTALSNQLCVLTLLGEHKTAIKEYEQKAVEKRITIYKPATAYQKELIYLSIALAYNEDKKNVKATSIWEDMIKNGSPIAKYQADFNLKISKGQICNVQAYSDCLNHPLPSQTIVDNIRLRQFESKNVLVNEDPSYNVEIGVDGTENSTVISFKKNNKTVMVLQKFNTDIPYKPDLKFNANYSMMVATNDGILMNCKDENIVFRFNQNKEQIVQWAKYFQRNL